jgi:uncharacterized protein with PIN domain
MKDLLRAVWIWLFRPLCPECGGYVRDCRTSMERGGKRVYLAPRRHGRKCVECGTYWKG